MGGRAVHHPVDPFQNAATFEDQINELRQLCTKKNSEQIFGAVLDVTSKERKLRIERTPDSYVALPICFLGTDVVDEFEVFWTVHGPGPFTGIDGRTARRAVDLGLVFHTMSEKEKRKSPIVEVIPHGLCFSDREDAEAMSYLLSGARKALQRKEAKRTRSVLSKEERDARRKPPGPLGRDNPGTEPRSSDG